MLFCFRDLSANGCKPENQRIKVMIVTKMLQILIPFIKSISVTPFTPFLIIEIIITATVPVIIKSPEMPKKRSSGKIAI